MQNNLRTLFKKQCMDSEFLLLDAYDYVELWEKY